MEQLAYQDTIEKHSDVELFSEQKLLNEEFLCSMGLLQPETMQEMERRMRIVLMEIIRREVKRNCIFE